MLLPTIKGKPVLLPVHNDVDLGQPIYHYHVDPRFVGSDNPEILADEGENVVFMEFPESEAVPKNVNFGISFYLQLLGMYEGRKLCGTRCPHRGIEVFHNRQCMGHGLRFDENGEVKGKLCESSLWLPGTKNMSANGVFDVMPIVEYMPKVTEVWLMWNGEMLAKNKFGPYHVKKGDVLKFSFATNDKNVVPGDCHELSNSVPILSLPDEPDRDTVPPLVLPTVPGTDFGPP